MSKPYSYHIFYFPFKWEIENRKDKLFSEQVNLESLHFSENDGWERVQYNQPGDFRLMNEQQKQEVRELFAEQNYYFDFVHPVLYDIQGKPDPMIAHFERKETKEESWKVTYRIKVKDKQEYVLDLEAINLNLYSTGVGVLSFFLANKATTHCEEEYIRDINQFGRRIMPLIMERSSPVVC